MVENLQQKVDIEGDVKGTWQQGEREAWTLLVFGAQWALISMKKGSSPGYGKRSHDKIGSSVNQDLIKQFNLWLTGGGDGRWGGERKST